MIRTTLTLLISACFLGCSTKQTQTSGLTRNSTEASADTHPGNGFHLIEDFEKYKNTFESDTSDLYEHSTDGGELILFHTKDKDYRVFDIWLYGETRKIHATYWTDSNLNFKLVKRTDFIYDKPYYLGDYKTEEVTQFFSYQDGLVKRYNSDRQEITATDNAEHEKATRQLFDDIVNDQ